MQTGKILVSESLGETLWRLEEARQGFRAKSADDVHEALEWVLSRQGLSGSYRGLSAPTGQDLAQGVRLLTGERIRSGGGAAHVLGEEALRAAFVWGLGPSPPVASALRGFNGVLERGGREGAYCCHTCTVAFLRTLAVVKPSGWDGTLEKGLKRMEMAQTSDGRWHRFPFYYTLLALSEMDTPSARAELRHSRKVAERLLERKQGDDRTSRFRRLGLEAALKAA